MPVTLMEHQRKAVDKLANGKILRGDVGSGKTQAALSYYLENEVPRDIYVITTAKKRDDLDWVKEGAANGIGTDKDATVQGLLHVDSWNNIGKYTEVKDAFFIFDEQRLVGSGAWSKAFIKIAKHNRWLMLTATPGDTWLDYIPVFIANGFYQNRTEFKRRHVVYNTFSKFPKVDHYVDVGLLIRLRNEVLVEMPFVRHTVRKTKYVNVDHDETLLDKVVNKRWHVFEERPLRDVAELFAVMRKVVNSDASRVKSVSTLMQKHPKLIVFYNFNYELDALRLMLEDHQQKRSTSSSIESSTSSRGKSGTSRTPSVEEDSLSKAPDSGPSSPAPASGTWEDTIWEEGWEPQEGETDPRTTIKAQKARSEFELKMRRSPGSTRKRGTSASSTSTSSSPAQSDGSGSGSKPVFAYAEWNGHLHQPIPDTDEWVYLVQYVAGAEGWNCIETDSMCFFSLTYSYKIFAQAHGRIDRLNTPFTLLYYYVLVSKSVVDKAVRRSLADKKNFNEREFGESFGFVRT